MMLRYLHILCVFICLASVPCYAQQEPSFALYMNNGMAVNPAYAGSKGQLSAVLHSRFQWVGWEGGPLTQAAAIHAPTADDRHGLGFSVLHDRTGFTSNMGFTGAYAFRIALADSVRLCLGMQLGLNHFVVRSSQVQTVNPNDVAFSGGNFSRWHALAGTGLYFHSRFMYAGISVPNLIKNRLYDSYYEELIAARQPHMYATAGLLFRAGDQLQIKPSALLRYVKGSPLSADLNLSFLIGNTIGAGVSVRPGTAIAGMAEVRLIRGMRFAYALEVPTGTLRNVAGISHEFTLGFDLMSVRNNMIAPRFF